MANMTIDNTGIMFLIDKEKIMLKMYKDSNGVPTIGVGHMLTKSELSSGKIYIKGEPVKWAAGLTKDQAIDLFMQDLERFIKCVNESVKVPLVQNQFNALVSFSYNVGDGAFKNSTLLKLLNQERYEDVPGQLKRWNKDGGVPVLGLTNRRNDEIELWNKV